MPIDGKRALMIVDDEMLIRWSLGERLTQEGYHVFEAEDGSSARRVFAIESGRMDAIILDLKLPDTDGLTLLGEFKGQKPACPVIMITAHGNEVTAGQAKDAGAYAFFNKPFKIDEIVGLVDEAIRASAA